MTTGYLKQRALANGTEVSTQTTVQAFPLQVSVDPSTQSALVSTVELSAEARSFIERNALADVIDGLLERVRGALLYLPFDSTFCQNVRTVLDENVRRLCASNTAFAMLLEAHNK